MKNNIVNHNLEEELNSSNSFQEKKIQSSTIS
jgi:hypothetical protein